MPDLSELRCFNHGSREAAARCLKCGRVFCRECVSEHEDRIVCARCLGRLVGTRSRRSGSIIRHIGGWGFAFAGVVLAWFFFHTVGRILLRIPTSFHDGTFLSNLQ